MIEQIKHYHYTDFDNPRYYNIKWLQTLEEADKIIKITGSVFSAQQKYPSKYEELVEITKDV
jgi:hypothetical protein